MEVLDEREWGLRVWGERRSGSKRAVREAEKSQEFCKPNSKSPPNAEIILCTRICDRPVTIGLRFILSVTDCNRSVTISDVIFF